MIQFIFLLLAVCDSAQATTLSQPIKAAAGGAVLISSLPSMVTTDTIILQEPGVLRLDRLEIRDDIETHGFPLTIEARELSFRDGAQIVAFKRPHAPTVGTGKDGEPTAAKGEDQGKGAQGNPGGSGAPGASGQGAETGKDGNGVGLIQIFAGHVFGTPRVSGQGETGGQGQKGGRGGRGQDGGKGHNADVNCLPLANRRAGNGGDAGPAGQGGVGGQGGRGGRAVPVDFYLGQDGNGGTELSGISSRPGVGGEPGPGGESGLPGNPGAGGDGDEGCFPHRTQEGGDSGQRDDETHPGIAGSRGQEGPDFDHARPNRIIDHFNKLESRRSGAITDWYDVHWWRNLYLLSIDTIRIVSNSELSRDGAVEALKTGNVSLLESADHQTVSEMTGFWEAALLDQLQSSAHTENHNPNVDQAIKIAGSVVELLKSLQAGGDLAHVLLAQRLTELSVVLDSGFKDRMVSATQSCGSYNEALGQHPSDSGKIVLSKLLTITTRYTYMPVCERNEGDLGSLEMPIWLDRQDSVRNPVISNNFKNSLREDSGWGDLYFSSAINFLKSFMRSPASSALPQRWLRWGKDNISIDDVLTGVPGPKNEGHLNGKEVLGYLAPTAAEVTRDTISSQLRILALQLTGK